MYNSEKEFYCVYTEGRTTDNIERTDYHEMAHHFAHQETEHFCGWKDKYCLGEICWRP